jgi:hypothetical protein
MLGLANMSGKWDLEPGPHVNRSLDEYISQGTHFLWDTKRENYCKMISIFESCP